MLTILSEDLWATETILIGASLLLFGCSAEVDSRTDLVLPSMAEDIVNNPEDYLGQRVTLRGFLRPRLGALALYPDEDSGMHSRFDEGSLLLNDSSSGKLRLESRYYENTCTNRLAEVVGTIGQLEG